MLSMIFLASALVAAVAAQFECQASSSIPYCVHQPEGASGLPMMVFMPGSGARGDLPNAASLATYDGLGKMISEYYGGNTDEKHTIAATKFTAVIPISPDGTRHFWPEDIKGIIEAVQSKYKTKGSKVGISGYSMGSRSCNRFAVTYPELVTSAGCSAGAAEQDGDSTLTQDPSRTASATFPLLSNAVKLPMMLFAGMSDETAGYTSTEAEEAELKKLGSTKAQIIEIQGATHSDMSTKPWTDTDYLSWAVQQAASSGGSKTSSATKPTKTSATKPATSTPASTDDGDDEDCEEDDEDETDSSDDDDEDCDDSDDSESTDATGDDEDCEEEDDSTESNATTTSFTKRDLSAEFDVGRQAHHFAFPHGFGDARAVAHRQHARRASAVVAKTHRFVRVKRH